MRDRLIKILATALDEWNGRENWPPHVSEDEASFLIGHLESRGYMLDVTDKPKALFDPGYDHDE